MRRQALRVSDLKTCDTRACTGELWEPDNYFKSLYSNWQTAVIHASGEPTLDASGIDAAPRHGVAYLAALALDKATGQIVWDKAVHTGVPSVKRHVKSSHASATAATNGTVIVALLDSEGLFCFDMSGTLKWRQDLSVIDVGLVDDPTYQCGPASSPIIDGSLAIVQSDRQKGSFVAAFDVATGKQAWRIDRDELPTWSTPLVTRTASRPELIYLASEDGDGFDVKAGRQFELLSSNPMGEICLATPAISGNMLIVRTQGHLVGTSAG